LLNGSVYFAIKSSAGTILQFELYPTLSTCNVEFVLPVASRDKRI